MNTVLRTVGAVALTFCIVSYFAPVKGTASVTNNHRAILYEADLRNIDTVTIDAAFKVIRQSAASAHRFHFIIQKAGTADLGSANISSDFDVANGFISAHDVLAVAQIVIDKMKTGAAPSINKADMALNKINY